MGWLRRHLPACLRIINQENSKEMKEKKLWQEIFMYGLGLAVTLGFFATVAILMFVELSPTVKDPLLLLLGVEATAFGAIVNYFYGSSKGSQDKQASIDKRLNGGA